jgi:hypothetical protein
MKNFKKTETPLFQDIVHADGSKTYDTVYGMITINRPFVVDLIESFLLGQIQKMRFNYLLQDGSITQQEYENIIRIID